MRTEQHGFYAVVGDDGVVLGMLCGSIGVRATVRSKMASISAIDSGNSQPRSGRNTGARAAANPVPSANKRTGAQQARPTPKAGRTATSLPNVVARHDRAVYTWCADKVTLTASSVASRPPSSRFPGLTNTTSQGTGRTIATGSNRYGARVAVSLAAQSAATLTAGPWPYLVAVVEMVSSPIASR